MRKRILCLAMAAVMVVGAQMTVLARDYQGKDNWLVTFDGKKMESNFESNDLSDEVANIQPGDSIDLKVKVKNNSENETDWYMSNEVIKSLEDSTKAADGGAYEYKLSYTNKDGNTVLYDSETVGGEVAQKGTGLHEVPEELGDYFYLDRLAKGAEGDVHLIVKVDGETQGNGYQNTLAKLQMTFAVEEVKPETKNVVKTVTKTVGQTIKTGDTAKPFVLCALALASGIVLLVLGVKSLKGNGRSRKNRKGGR